MPFTVPGFPTFTKFAVENMFPFINTKKINIEDRHFINLYLEALNFIKKSKFPIFGVVETSNSAPYIKNLLFNYKCKGTVSDKDYNNIIKTIKNTKLLTHLLEIILSSGQALKPIEMKKQIQGFTVTAGSSEENG